MAAKCVGGVGQLRVKLPGRRGEGDLGQERQVGVDADDLRLLGQGEVVVLGELSDWQGVVERLAVDLEPHRQWHVKEQDVVADLLCLLHADLGELGFLIPRVGDLQFGMVCVENVLIKKTVERPAGMFLDNRAQILGDDVSVAMPLEVGLDAFAEQIRPKLRAEHVQNPTALGVGEETVFAEHVLRDLVVAIDHRGGVVGAACKAFLVAVEAVAELVDAVLVPGEEVRVVGGESLVEPELAPVLAGDEVAEPLVRQLMRHQSLAAADVFRLAAEQSRGVERADAGVLHAAPVEVLHGHLVVLGPRIRYADFGLEILHALLGVAERVGGIGKIGGRGPERHREVAVFFLETLEVTGDERDEIIDVRFFLTPLDHSQLGFLVNRIGDLAAVGEGGHAVRHAAGHARGEKFVRRIEAREPVPRLDRFALCPDVSIAGVVAHLRSAEVESFFWFGLVGDGELGLRRWGDWLGEGDDQRPVGVLPRGDLGAAGDCVNLEVVRVEPQLAKRLEDRLKRERRRAGHAPVFEVGRDVEVEMLDVHRPIRGVALRRRVDAGPDAGGVPAVEAVDMLCLNRIIEAD